MTSDERRLEVAASLRASANVGGARTLKRDLARALGIRLDDYTPEGSHSKILRGLADLIDRPTCRNLAMKPADEFLCSKCGEHVDIAYMDSCDDYHARYCPNCGARVVSRDGD